jgi:hypothetical protein
MTLENFPQAQTKKDIFEQHEGSSPWDMSCFQCSPVKCLAAFSSSGLLEGRIWEHRKQTKLNLLDHKWKGQHSSHHLPCLTAATILTPYVFLWHQTFCEFRKFCWQDWERSTPCDCTLCWTALKLNSCHLALKGGWDLSMHEKWVFQPASSRIIHPRSSHMEKGLRYVFACIQVRTSYVFLQDLL